MKTIVVKVNNDCNQHCIYCGVGDVVEKETMDDKTLSNCIKKVANWNTTDGEISMQWYGGEPLLMGLDFYKKIIELQKSVPNHRFHNTIQTNGTILNNDFLDFFESNNIHISFSLDGCKEAHNLNRPYQNGKPSFDDTMHWLNETKKRRIGGDCVILVLNKNTASHIDNIYEFSKENNLSIKYNPQNRLGRAVSNNGLELSSKELAEVYIRLFDLWHDYAPKNRTDIRFFLCTIENIASIVNKTTGNNFRSDCSFLNTECRFSVLAVAPNGDFYPCGKFIGTKDFLYGNINETEYLSDNQRHPSKDIFIKRHKGLAECETCKYVMLCNSGCANAAFNFNGNIMSKNPYCNAFQKFFNHVEKKLLIDGKRKDIFVMPSNKSDDYIIYSPLRREMSRTHAQTAELIRDYVEYGNEIPKEYPALCEYIKKIEEMIIFEPNIRHINTQNDVIFLLSNKYGLACCGNQHINTQDSLTKDKVKIAIDYILTRYSRTSKPSKSFSFIGGCETKEIWDIFTWAIDYIKMAGKYNKNLISLKTNVSSLNEEKIIWLKNNDICLDILLDVLPEIQILQKPFLNKFNSFDVVDQNLKLLIFYNVDFSVSSTITNENVKLMPQIVNFVRVNYPRILPCMRKHNQC